MAMITDFRPSTRRNELILGIAVGLVVVLAVVGITLLITMNDDDAPADPGADARRLTQDSCAADTRQPAWVPQDVARASVACPEDISRKLDDSTSPDRLSTWIVYDLDGTPNEETIPGAAPDRWPDEEIASGAIHPATTITFVSYQGSEAIADELTGDTVAIDRQDFPQGGGDARVTRIENNGYGPVRVEWTDDDGSYVLLTVLGRTPDGRTGPTVDELLRMAGSLAG